MVVLENCALFFLALKSDLSVLLEPHPPLETPHQTDALDLTLTSDTDTSPARNPPNQSSIMKDITNVSHSPAQTAVTKRKFMFFFVFCVK